MHIIALEQEPSSKRGGQEAVLLNFCRSLQERGHKITLLYSQEGDLLEQYQKFCIQLFKVNRFIIYKPQQIFSFLVDIWKVNQKLPNLENSIVLNNKFTDTLFGYAIASSRNIPLVCYLHLPPPYKQGKIWQGNRGLKDFKKKLGIANIDCQWQLGLKGVKNFIAVSHQTKSDWMQIGCQENKIDVVYNGIDLEKYKPPTNFSLLRKEWNIPEDVKVISYVGRIDKEKGLETLIKAFALLRKKGLNTRLLIAGKPVLEGEDYKKSLEQLSANLQIENYVKFLGHVSNPSGVYQVSDVTVLPSLWFEPFGLVITESMACGTPMIASHIGGISEILTEEFQNLLFPPGNEQELSNTLNLIIDWREKDPQLSQRCREHIISKFSLEKMVDGIEKVIEKRFFKH
jgi:glycosyltransferase involved in cell wall biosynthesis